MRTGLFVVGVVVLILGVIVVGASFALSSNSTTIPTPATGQVNHLKITPSFIGSGTIGISWSGATSQFRFSVFPCSNSACSSWDPSPAANGAGASGSVSFSVSGSTIYVLVPTQNANAVPVTVQQSGGLTPLLLIGIIILVVGALVAVVGFRARAKPKTIYEDEVAPKRDSFVTTSTPFTGVQQGPAASATSAAPQYRPDAPEHTGPVFFQPTEGEESYGSNQPAPPTPPTGGVRPPIKCPSCGAMNEPWITNCRNCRRPLSSTGA
ncbi:MAG: hypothetical protein L3J95_05495 [Thermoplasmata archaeon]|nr:hypothetical protein [Thermoplasmata archaeon]